MKKLLALALAAAMLLSICVVAAAEEDGLAGTVVIIHTNDVHGAVEGYAKVAAMKKVYENQGADVLLLDAGGYLSGHPYVETDRGEAAVRLMNAAGYDLAAVGCNEFSYGANRLRELAGKAVFPMVSANVMRGGSAAFRKNQVFTGENGTKIGVFCLTTPQTADLTKEKDLQSITFLSGQALINCAREQVSVLKNQGCDVVICLSHLGIGKGFTSIKLLEEVEGIDYLIDGHSHSTLEEIKSATGGTGKVGDTVITSAGSGFEQIGVLLIKDGESVPMNLAAKNIVVSEDAVSELIDEIKLAVGDDEEKEPEVDMGTVPDVPNGELPDVAEDIVYSDVAAEDWYAGAVGFVTRKGLMNGSDGAFAPMGTLNRAMMVTVLYRMAGSPTVEQNIAFSDVAAGDWYADAVAWAVEQGITTGTSATTFQPTGRITREQLAVFLHRYAGKPDAAADLAAYRDAASVGSYAVDAMAWANAAGFLTGTSADTLSPGQAANRATVATVLMRYLQNS